jgi:hypothetical protein
LPAGTPRRYRTGSEASRLLTRLAQRQDLGRKANPLAGFSRGAVADLYPTHRDGADARLDGTYRAMTIADKAGSTIGEPLVDHGGQEGFGFRLDRLGK